jgi:hypothetical protein
VRALYYQSSSAAEILFAVEGKAVLARSLGASSVWDVFGNCAHMEAKISITQAVNCARLSLYSSFVAAAAAAGARTQHTHTESFDAR